MPNIARTTSGTSRIVVPVSSSSPNNAPMNSSGAAIQGVNPSDSGPPMAKPMNPAARRRSSGSSGEPDHRWRRPRSDRAIRLPPRISLGRASGLGWVRISTTATAAVTTGSARTRRTDERPQHGVHPRTDRPGGVEPRARGDDDGKTQQDQRDSVAAMSGLDVAGPPDRPRRTPGAPGRHQPGRPRRTAARQPRGDQQRPVMPLDGPARRFARLGGDAPSGLARGHAPRVKWPLTCSFGCRSGSRSY